MKNVKAIVLSIMLAALFVSLPAAAHAEDQDAIVETPSTVITHTVPDGISYNYELIGKPNGLTGVPSPMISYYVSVSGDADYSLHMLLDGKAVNAVYHKETGSLTYQPSRLTGTHEVEVRLSVYGKTSTLTTWNFTVDTNPVLPFENKNTALLSSIQSEAMNTLNYYRAAMKLPLFETDNALQQTAQAHSNYLQENHMSGHYEIEDGIGFTGVAPWDRGSYFGFTGNTGEGITYKKNSGFSGITDLMDAPYHRLSIINPLNQFAGTGYNADGDLVVNYGDQSSSTNTHSEVVLYPYDQQDNAKSSWFVAESPNPLRFWGIDQEYVGYPISFSYFTNGFDRNIRVGSLALKDSQNEDVPFYDVTPAREGSSKNYVFLIPKSPLEPGQTYTVQVEAYVFSEDGQEKDISRTWSFTTESDLKVEELYFKNYSGTNFLYADLAGGNDPISTTELKQGNKPFLKREQNRQWNYSPLTEGTYELAITSELFKTTQTLPLTITRNESKRFSSDGDWIITLTNKGLPGFTDWGPQQTVPTHKKWTIRFSQEIDASTVSSNSIFVQSNGANVKGLAVYVNPDKTSLTVEAPAEGYRPGQTYFLYINNHVKSVSGTPISKPIQHVFKIQ